MKIIVITPVHTGVYKDDTQMFCDGLEKYFGHEIVRAEIWYDQGNVCCRYGNTMDTEKFKQTYKLSSITSSIIYLLGVISTMCALILYTILKYFTTDG